MAGLNSGNSVKEVAFFKETQASGANSVPATFNDTKQKITINQDILNLSFLYLSGADELTAQAGTILFEIELVGVMSANGRMAIWAEDSMGNNIGGASIYSPNNVLLKPFFIPIKFENETAFSFYAECSAGDAFQRSSLKVSNGDDEVYHIITGTKLS